MTRTVLIVSPHFPPSTLAGVHRARHLAKHLPAFGWRPMIIRAHERHYTETPDPALAALVPDSVEQVRTGALPAGLMRFARISDIGIRAYTPVARAVGAAIDRFNPGAVLITGSPFYPMLMSGWLARKRRVPVVLDFQDPWVSAEGALRPRWSKGGLAHRLAVRLEPKAVRPASWITSVSSRQNAEMAARYPWLDPARMSAIPIGGDPDDFVSARTFDPTASPVKLDPHLINFCYVGTFLPRAGPVVRAIFDAARLLQSRSPDIAKRMHFTFVGTSNQPAGAAAAASTHRVLPIATEAGVADLVTEHPARVPFANALSILGRADGLLLIGSDEPHYTASKIYPALMSGRPFVSVFHAQSSSHEILTRAGGGASFAFQHLSELASLPPSIAEALERLARHPASFGRADEAAYAPFTARAVAGQFADVFDKVSR